MFPTEISFMDKQTISRGLSVRWGISYISQREEWPLRDGIVKNLRKTRHEISTPVKKSMGVVWCVCVGGRGGGLKLNG